MPHYRGEEPREEVLRRLALFRKLIEIDRETPAPAKLISDQARLLAGAIDRLIAHRGDAPPPVDESRPGEPDGMVAEDEGPPPSVMPEQGR